MKTKYDEGVEKLRELEDILIRLDMGGNITRSILIALIRAVWWLFREWVREHDPKRGERNATSD